MPAAGIVRGTRGPSDNRFPFRRVSYILIIVILFASVGLVAAAPVPMITGISPSGGPLKGGTPVTITGSWFTGTTDVQFGGVSGTALSVVNDSQITIITPSHEAGSVFISITTPAGVGTSPYPSTMFNYEEYPPPRVSSISPASGPMKGGTLVTITGSGLSSAGYVYFGRYGEIPKVIDDSHLTVTTLPSPPGLVPVTIPNTYGGGHSTEPPVMFLVEYPVPELTGISPSSGSMLGGTVVTITGSGLSGATDVRFGSISGTDLSLLDDNKLIVTSPPNAAGTVAISVINPSQTGSSPGAATVFRYDVPVPRLTGISPSSGSSDGGTAVTLTGSGFTGTKSIRIGGKPVTSLNIVSDNQITIITPPSSLGSFPISISNAYGEGGSLGPSTSFRYSITPTSTTAVTGATAAPGQPDGGDTGPQVSVTSPALAATNAPVASATQKTPGFEAVAGISALGAIILARKTKP